MPGIQDVDLVTWQDGLVESGGPMGSTSPRP